MNIERSHIVFGALAILSIVAIITVFIGLSINRSCQFIDVEPYQNLYNLHLMDSDNNQTLVGFAGYLMLLKAGVGRMFLPLIPKSIKVFGNSDRRSIVLETDCAEVNIKIWKTNATKSSHYGIVRLSANFIDYDGQFTICSTKKLDLEYNTNRYYSCKELNSHPCFARVSNTIQPSEDSYVEVARINLGIEVETDRESADVKPGEFTKPATYCPDGNWLSP